MQKEIEQAAFQQEDEIPLRKECWYDGFLELLVLCVNNAARKFPGRDVMLLGVEGSVEDTRTVEEYFVVLSDLNLAFESKKIKKKTESARIPFRKMNHTLEVFMEREEYAVIVFSCPTRGDEMEDVRDQVKSLCSGRSYSHAIDVVLSPVNDDEECGNVGKVTNHRNRLLPICMFLLFSSVTSVVIFKSPESYHTTRISS